MDALYRPTPYQKAKKKAEAEIRQMTEEIHQRKLYGGGDAAVATENDENLLLSE